MENQTFTNVRKLTTSGIVIALYVVIFIYDTKFFFRGLSDPYCNFFICPFLSFSVPGYPAWSR